MPTQRKMSPQLKIICDRKRRRRRRTAGELLACREHFTMHCTGLYCRHVRVAAATRPHPDNSIIVGGVLKRARILEICLDTCANGVARARARIACIFSSPPKHHATSIGFIIQFAALLMSTTHAFLHTQTEYAVAPRCLVHTPPSHKHKHPHQTCYVLCVRQHAFGETNIRCIGIQPYSNQF